METPTSVVQHRLVHVRGGPLMLFTALCVSLPREAQRLLPVFLWLLPSLLFLKVPQLATSAMQRVLVPLFTRALSDVVGSSPTLSPWRPSLPSSQLLAKLTQFTLQYLTGKKVAKLILATGTRQNGAASPADFLALLPDSVVCDRVLSVVESTSPASSPATLRSSCEGGLHASRTCESFFACGTTVALRSYLHHVLARASHEHVTIYIPGLLTAPWTSHVVPLLRQVQRQHGAVVLGYDVVVDAHRYDIDLHHLRQLEEKSCVQRQQQQQQQQSRQPRSFPTSSNAKKNSSGAITSETHRTSTAAHIKTGVLVLASLRGRCVHNRHAAIEFAKMRGWDVVELCLPTLPVLHAERLAQPTGLTQALLAPRSEAWTLPMKADLRITAFDDVGMYGGAAVQLCSQDPDLFTHMMSECQPATVDSAEGCSSALAPTAAAARVALSHARKGKYGAAVQAFPATALTTTTDVVHRTNEFLMLVWLPWASRLYQALQSEAAVAMHGVATIQQAFLASSQDYVDRLLAFPAAVQQKASWLFSREAFRSLQKGGGGGRFESDGGSANMEDGGAGLRITADATVEQRTTVIAAPLPPLDLVAPPAWLEQQRQQEVADAAATNTRSNPTTTRPSQEDGAAATNALASAEEGLDKVRRSSNPLISWISRLPKTDPTSASIPSGTSAAPSAAAEVVAGLNTPAEWRIRLRWTALLLAAYADAITGVTRRSTTPLVNDVSAAAYVSLWSFVAQLPPWVTAVSVDAADAPRLGEGGESSGIEVAATALLVRVAYPASARTVAQQLRDEALVEAEAVSPRTWNDMSTPSSSSSVFAHAPGQQDFRFEEAVRMPNCPHAAAVTDELLYLPLTSATGQSVREAMLRVLWEKVSHAEDVSGTARRTDAAPPHVVKALNSLYGAYLASTSEGIVAGGEHDVEGRQQQQSQQHFRYSIRTPDGQRSSGESARDAERAQSIIFRTARAAAASAAVPPSFVTGAASSIVAPVQKCVAQKLQSML